jgi:hypothetical protein
MKKPPIPFVVGPRGRSCNNPSVLALLVVHALFAAAPSDVERSVCLLQSSHSQREEAALLYALRIYTRDLKTPITISKIPSRAESRGDAQTGAKLGCASGATLVVWFSGKAGESELSVLRCDAEKEYRLPLQPTKDLDLAAQTLALKIRGLLTEAAASEGDIDEASIVGEALGQTAPQEAASEGGPNDANQGPVAPGQAVSASFGPPNKDQPDQPEASDLRKPVIEGGPEWAFGAASAYSGLRQGLLLRIAIVSARLPLALEVDGAFMTSIGSEVGQYHLSVSEIPIGIALSARLTRWFLTVSCGPRVSLHRVQSDTVDPDGHSGSATNLAAGLGAVEHVYFRVSDTVSLVLSLSNEAIVPPQRVTLDGQKGLDVGRFQWTLSGGVVVRP